MKLPNGGQAIVDDDKLLDYVLNPTHPIGRHHARLFESLLGIAQRDYRVLSDALRMAAKDVDAVLGKSSPFGRKFETRFEMTGPTGSKTVLAVWIIATGDDRPRLVTCYVE